ncbi:hypothetical protein [Hymenobacter weizhouensis]|uniref:hypothetical protein n=1 Tax=Hymenobacter sp. YIM 151500-1 TaxID=2987689 RepID=UPI00222612C4|nr:hypothetical protein [Hymenobacter sp. YIM 151500-1]UYZ63696.1 hypothetical protein OIS53_02355 [Hymenobacter sp. YIM 151500-1]
MPLDPATFLQHTAPAEKTVVHVRTATGQTQPHDALLVAQTPRQKLFVTLEPRRRYLTHTQHAGPDDVELDFVQDYDEVESLLAAAGRFGPYDGQQGILYHHLLYLLVN